MADMGSRAGMKSGGRRKSKESEAMCAGHVEGAHNTGWEQCVSDNPGLRHLESQALGWLDRDIRSQCLIHDGRRPVSGEKYGEW